MIVRDAASANIQDAAMTIKDVDAPIDVDELCKIASGPGPYPWTFARDVRLACAEIVKLRELVANAANWLEANTDRDARRFAAKRLRRELGDVVPVREDPGHG